jgi:guanine nucleotide-binding protein alpha-1 subunit
MSWRAVIQLNLVRAVNIVLDALHSEISGKPVQEAELDDESPNPEFADGPQMSFTEKHQLLKLRLTPLRRVEADLRTCLGETGDLEEYPIPNFHMGSSASDPDSSSPTKRKPQEFSVRSWKNVLEKNSAYSQTKHAIIHAEDATEVIAGCREDIKSLWDDSVVRQVLYKRKVNLSDSATL